MKKRTINRTIVLSLIAGLLSISSAHAMNIGGVGGGTVTTTTTVKTVKPNQDTTVTTTTEEIMPDGTRVETTTTEERTVSRPTMPGTVGTPMMPVAPPRRP